MSDACPIFSFAPTACLICLKFVHTPGLLVVLNEMNADYRQVFTDGRALPGDPNPSWQGYSSAKWDGDTLVVDTIGFRDDTWIDWNGSVVTSTAKVRERIRRPDFGHLEIEVTVDDPKAYTRPWTVTLRSSSGPMRSSSTKSVWKTKKMLSI